MSEHSVKFDKVKDYYNKGLWTKEMVLNAIDRWITKEEAEEIING